MIRDFRPADAEAVASAHRAGREHLVRTAEALLWANARQNPGEHFRTIVAPTGRTATGPRSPPAAGSSAAAA
ncbi:hypothetical protein AB0C76_06820 [Kitasatospora sp. NPDC048722]|uniref:hypothetical protein n=1 Tax=Kitasatospora sp. NPDC048722 TaxID=3155639 RepID=UPI0033FC1087